MTRTLAPPPVLIVGPTASGKSRLGLALAERLAGALVVNADALQVYDGWRALTARPSPCDLTRAEHALYGYVDPADSDYSVGRWLRDVAPVLAQARQAERPVLIIGGTGLYFKALTEGLAPTPRAPRDVRARIEKEIAEEGLARAAARLAAEDPETAAKIDARNPRRVLRALEVLAATGRGLADWTADPAPPVLPLENAVAVRIETDRAWLRRRIAQRLRAMIDEGALEEVAAMRARGVNPEAPAMKALGARALAAHLDGSLSLDAALEAAALETGRYAKRQDTWARNQFAHWRSLDWREEPEAAADRAAEQLFNDASRRW